MKRFLVAAVSATALLAATCAAQAEGVTARIEIRGYVPVICNADFSPQPPQPGMAGWMHLGAVHEFCNSGSGFQLVVDYLPTSDPGTLVVDGRQVRLDGSGHTVIERHAGPAIETSLLGYIPGRQPISNLHISMQSFAI
ncbi:MAG: hypothetical protein WBQ17_03340 [Rhizomicrobium sp.]|jgi:opacity protein-like surface antigen